MTPEEYNICVDKWADALFRFAVKTLQNDVIAQDVVQESFEKLWVNRKKIENVKAKAYLFTAAYHNMIDLIRHSKVKDQYAKAVEPITDYLPSYSDLNVLLHQAIEKLPPDQRSVLLLCDYEGYSYKEIAEITQLSESQVKVYIHRGRASMRQYIKCIEYII